MSLLAANLFGQANQMEEDLLAAARKGDAAAIESLLKQGANIETKTRHGITPLFYAARNGHEAAVKLLLDKGANPNITDTFYGMTLLGAALEKPEEARFRTARLLLERGSKQGDAVLESAARAGRTELLELVLKGGAAKPDTLTRALAAAETAKKDEAAAMLRAAGAKPMEKPLFQVDEATLKTYAGRYKNEQIGEWTFTVKDGKLMFDPGGQTLELAAYDKTKFSPVDMLTVKLTFSENAVLFERGQQRFELKKVVAQ